jgi:chaperone BCS1
MLSHQISIIDVIFPGFSGISASIQQLLAGNLNSHARILCIVAVFVIMVRYAYRYAKGIVEDNFSIWPPL